MCDTAVYGLDGEFSLNAMDVCNDADGDRVDVSELTSQQYGCAYVFNAFKKFLTSEEYYSLKFD